MTRSGTLPQRRDQAELRQKFGHVAHLARELRAACSCAGSSAAKRCVYSLSVEPQPAALVTIASNSSHGNASKFARASLRATSRTPA